MLSNFGRKFHLDPVDAKRGDRLDFPWFSMKKISKLETPTAFSLSEWR